MCRVINEVRAQHLREQPLEYVYHPSFDDPALEGEILGPMPSHEDYQARKRAMRIPRDVPPELASLYELPLLNKEQEQHLFRQMNFLKHKINQRRDRLDPARARTQHLKDIKDLQARAQDVKDLLISANMRLVVSIAKRHSGQADNFFELLSDGNLSLLRAVEKFDISRGNKFSTYASWAIMKNFARSTPKEKRHRERYVTGHEDLFASAADTRTDEREVVASAEQAARWVTRLLGFLDPREREIIRMRAGLDENGKNMTLEEIGHKMGITKERVRQLKVRIMKKLRDIAHAEHMDLP
jgi:RNA polymerase sigma factor (sigma-70 family)